MSTPLCEFIMWKPGSQQQKQLASLDLGFLAYLLISPFIPSTAVLLLRNSFFWCRSTPCSLLYLSVYFWYQWATFLAPLFFDMYWPPCTDQWIHEVPKGYFLLFLAFVYLSISLSPSLYFGRLSKQTPKCLLLVQHLILNMVFPLSI